MARLPEEQHQVVGSGSAANTGGLVIQRVGNQQEPVEDLDGESMDNVEGFIEWKKNSGEGIP